MNKMAKMAKRKLDVWQEQWNRNRGGTNNEVRERGNNEDSGRRKFKKGSEEEKS